MEILVDERGDGIADGDLRRQLEAILKRDSATEGEERTDLLRSLAAIFEAHTPHSYLRTLEPEELVARLRLLLRFLESRRDNVAVEVHPSRERGRTLLFTNSPDAPFILDTVQSVLVAMEVRFQVVSHPILTVRRRRGTVVGFAESGPKRERESLIVVRVEKEAGADADALAAEIRSALQAVLQVHRAERSLTGKLREMEQAATEEAHQEFFRWLSGGNFHPFSYRGLLIEETSGVRTLREIEDSRIGLAQAPDCIRPTPFARLEPPFAEHLLRRDAVAVEEEGRLSPILRAEPLVYIGFRQPVGDGTWHEHAFLGLFSKKSVDEPTFSIPPLRRRLETALAALAIPKGCHDHRKTIEIFNTFPKVELFFMEPAVLQRTIRSFTLLYRHDAVKIVAARGLSRSVLTLLVIMPRGYFATEVQQRLERFLRRRFDSPSAVTRIIHVSSDYLSLHIVLRPRSEVLRIDSERVERSLTRIARPWKERLRLLLERSFGEKAGETLGKVYADRFSREYCALIHPRFALRDVVNLEKVRASGREMFDLWGPFSGEEPFYRLQFYSCRASYLNELMPLLENLQLQVIDEVDFTIGAGPSPVFIKSFAIRGGSGAGQLSLLRGRLLAALIALRSGEAENDYLNRLLVLTGLSWREIDVFRGYRNYYFQLGSTFSKRRVAFALINNPRVARLLYRYFEGRFRPDPRWADLMLREEEALSPVRQELIDALESVGDINEDRILRILFNLIDSTVRTNFFLRRDRDDYFFSFKISAIGIIDMPAPRPLYEIYVHSATMEGIHLRGGRVARGGIRWSDRPDDFRTEVLGLMKTQMSKNALIVPVGSKGGFVIKTSYASREEGSALAKAAYQTLMRGLLDLTDNRSGSEVLRPGSVVTYDEVDPYLVVAADKGTAHLPDTANDVSAEYSFWLGDAFASGGSRGYDHKALGITARGAWECVKRHFREMGRDIQEEPFTVVGIGDMSGDVFGNGMLLSRQIRLLAAFDHRHIFLDPDPDPQASWEERKRLFALPRSSWDDYDRRLISAGGGVFPRDAKDISLSEPVRRWLGIRHESMDGLGLIRLLLGAKADLLWNGGIGTYVKASSEKHEEVGDRANDAVRIDAPQLRALVVGEGGNLGFTQKARIEYALAGGRINTDAVDNSGGVDCSDHEVNLKIFMQQLLGCGEVSSLAERDRLLSKVADEVCAAVLANNYSQSLCLSLDAERCGEDIEPFLVLADRLAAAGLLDRQGEFLPTSRDLAARRERTLVRPELAILMAYSKMQIYRAILESELPGQPGVRGYLAAYFPRSLRERFAAHLEGHPLAREIAATMITNALVDQGGSTFSVRLAQQTGAPLAQVVAAYLFFDQVLEADALRRQIHALDNRVTAATQHLLLRRIEELLATFCLWALERGRGGETGAAALMTMREQVDTFTRSLGGVLAPEEWQACQAQTQDLEREGLPPELARQLAVLPYLVDFLPVAALADESGVDLYSAARSYHELRDHLGVREVLLELEQVQVRDRWDRLALQMLRGGYASVLFRLAAVLLRDAGGNLEAFVAGRRQKVHSYRGLRESLRGAAPANYHPYSVLLKALEGLLV